MKDNKIEIINYDDDYNQPMVLCLGFFDSLHLGHKFLISQARLMAHKYASKTAVFTFSNNPFEILRKTSLQVLSFDERCYRLEQLEVDIVVKAEFNLEFADLSPKQYLDNIFLNKKIVGVVVGSDYAFGKNAEGNIAFLNDYCQKCNAELLVCNLKMQNEREKFSSRSIRTMVRNGEVEKINEQLHEPYIVMGKVISGRGDGHRMSFPTANINFDSHKEKLKEGVYYTNIVIDGVCLRALTNVGEHPTFDDNNYNIESYILFYDKDLYGKNIVVEFYKRLRDTIKFNSPEELTTQIISDLEFVKNIK